MTYTVLSGTLNSSIPYHLPLMALNSMYCVDVPLHAASGLFMLTLPPKRGTTRKQKLIKKGEFYPERPHSAW